MYSWGGASPPSPQLRAGRGPWRARHWNRQARSSARGGRSGAGPPARPPRVLQVTVILGSLFGPSIVDFRPICYSLLFRLKERSEGNGTKSPLLRNFKAIRIGLDCSHLSGLGWSHFSGESLYPSSGQAFGDEFGLQALFSCFLLARPRSSSARDQIWP